MKELTQIALLIFFIGIVSPAFSQLAWTPEQKAVWKTETTIFGKQET